MDRKETKGCLEGTCVKQGREKGNQEIDKGGCLLYISPSKACTEGVKNLVIEAGMISRGLATLLCV